MMPKSDGSLQSNRMVLNGPDQVADPASQARLCVLGSGSAGNCTALQVPGPHGTRSLCLIDLGFSPRSTQRLLESAGLSLDMVNAVLLTHLDSDHLHPGWVNQLTRKGSLLSNAVKFHLAASMVPQIIQTGFPYVRLAPFENAPFEPCDGVTSYPLWVRHDEHGSIAYRFQIREGESSAGLGFATDLGRASRSLHDLFGSEQLGRSVDTLVIESNYCPTMQSESCRPAFVKKRVTGGRGHLSNQQAFEAARCIAPREHVVLIHLSRQCNRPEIAARLHNDAPYMLTLSDQYCLTPWVPVRAGRPVQQTHRQMLMWT